ncbi:seven-hairpin glycosidase, partial [Ramicandelaber brevisporus]
MTLHRRAAHAAHRHAHSPPLSTRLACILGVLAIVLVLAAAATTVQAAPLSAAAEKELWRSRQARVVNTTRRIWNSYERDAWGMDVYHPVSRNGTNLTQRGFGFTIVDALDTLHLLGLTTEFARAREYVRSNLTLYQPDGKPVSTFETTIRVLGGLLSAHYLTQNDTDARNGVFLQRAVELGGQLAAAFDTPTGMPRSKAYLLSTFDHRARELRRTANDAVSSMAEVGSVQLEFRYLSYLTGDPQFRRLADNAYNAAQRVWSWDGL